MQIDEKFVKAKMEKHFNMENTGDNN